MKKLIGALALIAVSAVPTAASASMISSVGNQSVWKTVSTTEIVNSDGSVTEVHVTTRYYFLGVE